MAEVYLDASTVHAFWDRDLQPRLTIESGDVVTFDCRDASDSQITRNSDSAALLGLDFGRIHPLTGPVAIQGAEPGDALVVEVLKLEHKGWGWNAVVPGFGLLAEDFQEPYLHHYRLDRGECHFNGDVVIPYEPFCGVMGVAPAETGRLGTIPPRINGGNIDIRGLGVGSVARFPVLVPGALFSTADCHSAQGDGEVNGTGVETPMLASLRFTIEKGSGPKELQFTTPSPLTRCDSAGYFCTTAHGPDLYSNCKTAIRYMIDHLVSSHGLTRNEAYCLCGAAVDLKVSEVVDAPNWIVSAYLPLSIFA
jgi:acetamidase/formamidase